MKITSRGFLLGLLSLFSFSLTSFASFNYASSVRSSIQFDGAGNFFCNPAKSNLWVVSGSASGLYGEISGTFTIGAITTVGSDSSAPVTGTGTFVIHDGANDLTATVLWNDISQSGTAGFLNLVGNVNLTAVTYGGSNPDLLALKNAGSGINVLSFQFIPAVSLATLKSSGVTNITSFSGTVQEVQQPSCDCTVTFNSPQSITNCASEPIPDVTATQICNSGSPVSVTVTLLGAVTNGTCPQIITRTNGATDSCGVLHTFVQTITVNCLGVTVHGGITCAGTPVSISANTSDGAAPFHYVWGVPAGASNPGDVASFASAVGGVYSVTVTDANGCTATNSASLIVYPSVSVTVTGGETCAGTPSTITATPAGGAGSFHYTWTVPVGATNPGDTNTFDATVAGTYSVVVLDANGCGANGSADLKVNPLPDCTIKASVSSAIAGTAGYKASVANAGAGATYVWVLNNANITSGQGTTNITWTAGTDTNNPVNICVTVTTAAGCGSTCCTSVPLSPKPPQTNVGRGDTATIGFWQNKNGQGIILNATNPPALGNWLAANFPCFYGDLAGKPNSDVAARFIELFKVKGQKTYAQIMAGAFACYFTSSSLGGNNNSAKFGFNISPGGTGDKLYNVGSLGTAIGLQNNTSYTVFELLQAANAQCPLSKTAFDAFNTIFDGINTTGDIK